MGKGIVLPVPADAPKPGDLYKHYKQGDVYKVVGVAINAGDNYDGLDEWMVIYEPMYEEAAAPMFARPLAQWHQEVEWEGQKLPRFSKVCEPSGSPTLQSATADKVVEFLPLEEDHNNTFASI
jgi:hypothetical protein